MEGHIFRTAIGKSFINFVNMLIVLLTKGKCCGNFSGLYVVGTLLYLEPYILELTC